MVVPLPSPTTPRTPDWSATRREGAESAWSGCIAFLPSANFRETVRPEYLVHRMHRSVCIGQPGTLGLWADALIELDLRFGLRGRMPLGIVASGNAMPKPVTQCGLPPHVLQIRGVRAGAPSSAGRRCCQSPTKHWRAASDEWPR